MKRNIHWKQCKWSELIVPGTSSEVKWSEIHHTSTRCKWSEVKCSLCGGGQWQHYRSYGDITAPCLGCTYVADKPNIYNTTTPPATARRLFPGVNGLLPYWVGRSSWWLVPILLSSAFVLCCVQVTSFFGFSGLDTCILSASKVVSGLTYFFMDWQLRVCYMHAVWFSNEIYKNW